MFDVVALGELLIDFAPQGKSAQGNALFEACPGGAPCNVLAMLAKLGGRTAFIGKLGNDIFGHRLRDTVSSLGIDTRGVVFDGEVNTTLAFVSIDDTGERSFSFYRTPGADMRLRADEVDLKLVRSTRIFHFGSLSTTHQEVREATRSAVTAAKAAGALISFDPNLRPPLWGSLSEAREQILWGCSECDILKVSAEEAEFLTGEKTPYDAASAIQERFPHIRLIFVTSGRDGSAVLHRGRFIAEPAFETGKTIDTTGAGDTFFACCLHAVLRDGIGDLSEEQLRHMLCFANAAAAIVTTRKGALLSMPDMSEIRELMGGRGYHPDL